MCARRKMTICVGLLVTSQLLGPALTPASAVGRNETNQQTAPPEADAPKRFIYFEGEPIELAMYTDKIAVWFEPGLTNAERTEARSRHDVIAEQQAGFAGAEVVMAFEPSSTEVYRLAEPLESDDLLQQVRA